MKKIMLELKFNLKLIKLIFAYILMFYWQKQVGRNFWLTLYKLEDTHFIKSLLND